ncbi:MAG: alpha/beta fold hydrolase [Bacteroidales bacterium]|nr:alpha/beta fold hydrolase [Bacteroidales bacterium]
MRTIILFTMVLFMSLQGVMALEPVREYAVKPDEFGIDYEEISITTSDELTLKGWLYKPREQSSKAIILSHSGNGNMADLIEIASNFVTLGYYVITYDYRGYGESSDFTINNNFYMYAQFEFDLNAAIDYTKRYLSRARTIHLWGVGMGAGLSLAVGANRNEISGVIADSPYSTLEGIKSSIADATGQNVLLPLGFNRVAIEPEYALKEKGQNLQKVLFIVGDEDEIYTTRNIRELAKLKRGATVFTVRDSNYRTNFTKDKHKYFEEIASFAR